MEVENLMMMHNDNSHRSPEAFRAFGSRWSRLHLCQLRRVVLAIDGLSPWRTQRSGPKGCDMPGVEGLHVLA